MIREILFSLTVVSALSFVLWPDRIETCPDYGKREHCVHDGDTVWWKGTKTRAADYDTPELSPRGSYCPDRETRLAWAARDRLVALLNSGEASVVLIGRTGRSGRALARYYVDGVQIGPRLIQEGLAQPWTGRRQRQLWCHEID